MNNNRLKLALTLALVTIITVTSCKQEVKEVKHDGYTVKGTIKGLDKGWIKLTETGSRGTKPVVLDSTEIVNGSFTLQGKVEAPDMAVLLIDNKNSKFFLENSNIDITIDWSEVKPEAWQFESQVSGSKTHDEYIKMDEKAQAVFKSPKYAMLDSVRVLYTKAKKSNDPKLLEEAKAFQKKMFPLVQERSTEYADLKYNYARNNPSSPVAVHVLGLQYSDGRMSKEQLKEFYNLFTGDAKKTAFYRKHITKVYKDIFENLGIGNKAPDFTLNTAEGTPLTLSNVKAKYRLIDFWASWCIPCRASFPHLKELRKKYGADKFEIVGIGTADKEDKWKKAIEEDQIPWLQVFDVADEGKRYGSVAELYSVPFLPTTFLIDENQTIVLRNASKDELDAKLKELLGF